MPQLSLLAKITKEAGQLLLAMQPDVVANKNGEQQIKPDGSIVTTADLAANEFVIQKLLKNFPGVAIGSEENSEEDNKHAYSQDESFDLDALDNTSGYVANKDGFSVNIGRTKNGVPIDGAIYFPRRGELYFVGDDGNAYLQLGDTPPKQIKTCGLPLKDPLKVAVGFNEQDVGHLQNLGRAFTMEKYSAQLRMCKVMIGECALTGINRGNGGGFNRWDIAGPHAVLLAAGGEMLDLAGNAIRYHKGEIKIPEHFSVDKDVARLFGLASPQALKDGRQLS